MSARQAAASSEPNRVNAPSNLVAFCIVYHLQPDAFLSFLVNVLLARLEFRDLGIVGVQNARTCVQDGAYELIEVGPDGRGGSGLRSALRAL